MHDNFSSHKSDEIAYVIQKYGHIVICRVPYRTKEAPIEFAFNMLVEEIMSVWANIKNEKQLITEINNV